MKFFNLNTLSLGGEKSPSLVIDGLMLKKQISFFYLSISQINFYIWKYQWGC